MAVMEEKWKDIPGLDGYMISSDGRLAKILKPGDNGKGYKTFSFRHKINKYIHRLVAEAFIPNPNNYPEVNHKDCVRYNNNVNNLEWCDKKYNCNYEPTKIARKNNDRCIKVDCYDLNNNYITTYNSLHEASEKTGCSRKSISACCNGFYKQSKGFIWKYWEYKEK